MKCTACGNENQPGAKFCVHCGVVLSLTAPSSAIAPTTAAPFDSTSTGQRPAFAPQPASPAQTAGRPAAPIAPPPAAATPAPGTAPPAAPAQRSSRMLGPTIAGIALLVVLGAAGYYGYRMLAGEGSKQATATAEPPPTEAQRAAPAAEPEKEAATTSQAPAEAASASSPTATPGEAMPPTSGTPVPGQPATRASAAPKTAVARAAPKTAPAKPVQTPPAMSTPAQAPAPAPAPSKAPPPSKTVTAQADRWQMYADEMARCAKENFFARLGCQQRTRAQYCEGYWGKVPQCPTAPPVERGQ
jgi:hypothetical protein